MGMRIRAVALVLLMLAAVAIRPALSQTDTSAIDTAKAAAKGIQIGGVSWVHFGKLVRGSYFPSKNTFSVEPKVSVDGWLPDFGGLLFLNSDTLKPFRADLVVGMTAQVPQVYTKEQLTDLGAETDKKYYNLTLIPLLLNAELHYCYDNLKNLKVQGTVGRFPLKYNQHVRNLGLYLHRGTVYPGYLKSGFSQAEAVGLAYLLGIKLHATAFNVWDNDVLLVSETQNKPFFDFSPSYLTGVRLLDDGLEIGAGINFHRLISVDERLTTPATDTTFFRTAGKNGNNNQPKYYYVVDTSDSNSDTIFYTHRGIKVMGRLAFDPKKIFGASRFSRLGKNDAILYGEVGIIGLKDYPIYYEKISERIPVMIGFNIPTFRILDVLAFEIEYYGARYPADSRAITYDLSPTPWVLPQKGNEDPDPGSRTEPIDSLAGMGDNWKWSLYAERKIFKHLTLKAQVASDHSRFFAIENAERGATEEVMEQTFFEDKEHPGKFLGFPHLKDWYWMIEIAYGF